MNRIDWSRATWRKSSHSGGQSAGCVEAARIAGTIGVRDSKNPELPNLELAPASFRRLLARTSGGELDLRW